jgi:hypothetical protein
METFAQNVLLLARLGSEEERAALAKSIKLLLDRTPELAADLQQPMPAATTPGFDEFVRSLSRLLSRAQAAELLIARREAGVIKLTDTVTRRERIVLASWLPDACRRPAPTSEEGSCKLLQDFETVFADTLGALAPQSTQSAGDAGKGARGLTAQEFLAQAHEAISERTRFATRCNAETQDAKLATELCTEFGAAVALELHEHAGELSATAHYVSRTVNDDDRSDQRAVAGFTIAQAGERLAMDVLLGAAGWKNLVNGVEEGPTINSNDEHARFETPVNVRPSWYERPQTWFLIAGFVGVISGVYVSNVDPSARLGDGLWLGGALSLGTGVVWEIAGD